MENFNIKEMYEACFKATKTMKVGNRIFDAGEPFLYFQNLKIDSIIQADKKPILLSGGKNNPPLMIWQENNQPITITIGEGTLDKFSFGLLSDAKVFIPSVDTLIFKNEFLETNSAGAAQLKYNPHVGSPFFAFVISEDGHFTKITTYDIDDDKITTSEIYKKIFVSYYYIENTKEINYILGYNNLNNAFFNFEGKMYYQEESKGENKTCLIKAPKVQILSSLYLKVGAKVNPMVANFKAIAFPIDGNNYTLSLRYLDKDVDADL